MNYFNPSLVEPGAKYFFHQSLKKCHEFKEIHYNALFNIYMFCIFIIILTAMLLYKWKGKLTPEEIMAKEYEKNQYILDKIKMYKEVKLKTNQALITGLPYYEGFSN